MKRKQVAPIEVQNPDESETDETGYGTCLCCGEDAQTHGICLDCVFEGCNADFDVACRRTGAVDPEGLFVPTTLVDTSGVGT